MNKRLALWAAVLVATIAWGAVSCGEDEGQNECEEHAEFILEATLDACDNYDSCCFCDCARSGSSSLADCNCDAQNAPTGDFEGECEGGSSTQADNCLSDKKVCEDKQAQFVFTRCGF
jgi:hypothetical protein